MEEINTFIDTVQGAKKLFVKSVITNSVIADGLISFIDAQTSYTKEAAKATISSVGVVAGELAKINEQFCTGVSYKKLQEKVSNDLYSTFWKEAFKYYSPSHKY